MTKIECADVKDLLPEGIRNELSESDGASVAEHISSCAMCAEEVELLRRIQAAAFSTPASLSSEIKSALAREVELGAGVSPGPAGRWSTSRSASCPGSRWTPGPSPAPSQRRPPRRGPHRHHDHLPQGQAAVPLWRNRRGRPGRVASLRPTCRAHPLHVEVRTARRRLVGRHAVTGAREQHDHSGMARGCLRVARRRPGVRS